jgi:phosphoribosyl 1,2-cyclic phosphodiesterase
MEFCVLSSGSGGNASFVRHAGFGLLIELGLSPRRLEAVLAKAGLGWRDINAVVLSHAHGDHWNDAAGAELLERGIPLFCHQRHVDELAVCDSAFLALQEAGLVNLFELDRDWWPCERLRCRSFAIPHDADLTCGFRIEGLFPDIRLGLTLGYASDLGTWHEGLVKRLRDVDILALEFNHDETMQRESGRPRFLINRVLGARGHLSNHQAAEFFRRVLLTSRPGRPSHLVQLHLSRQCNTRELAALAARQIVEETRRKVKIHTAPPTHPTMCIHVEPGYRAARTEFHQLMLPGWEASGS